MGLNSRRIKNRAMEILESDEYQEARDEEFDSQFRDFLSDSSGVLHTGIWTEDDLTGFIDSFDFPTEEDYAMDKACSEADDYVDIKMQEAKDEKY